MRYTSLQYFYHPDHLGSASWITDADGNGYQHLQYLPPDSYRDGESWVEQRLGNYNTPYQFSGKERDEETGYNYFGARYYDSELSVWLSVDPMAGKYPSTSSYMYCLGNPMVLIDPDGRSASPILDEAGNLLGTDNQGWTGTAIVMNKNDFKQGMDHNDALNKGTELNVYSKGINITNETWNTIQQNGGEVMKPFVENNTSQTVYYKPETSTKYVQNDGAYPIGPGKDLYSPVDGVNSTVLDPQKVYKVPTGYRVIIDPDGLDIKNFLEDFTPNYGEVNAPDPTWYNLRDCFNHLESRRPKN